MGRRAHQEGVRPILRHNQLAPLVALLVFFALKFPTLRSLTSTARVGDQVNLKRGAQRGASKTGWALTYAGGRLGGIHDKVLQSQELVTVHVRQAVTWAGCGASKS
jgi:hypothetical protein